MVTCSETVETQRLSSRQLRVKENNLDNNRKTMPQPNRNFDPPGQGGFNPFIQMQNDDLSQSFTDTENVVDQIDKSVQQYGSNLKFDDISLIPQPFSSHLMPLSGNVKDKNSISKNIQQSSDSPVHIHTVEPGEHHLLIIKTDPYPNDLETTITIRTLPSKTTQPVSTSSQKAISIPLSSSSNSVYSSSSSPSYPSSPSTSPPSFSSYQYPSSSMSSSSSSSLANSPISSVQHNREKNTKSERHENNKGEDVRRRLVNTKQPMVTTLSPLFSHPSEEREENTQKAWNNSGGFCPASLPFQREPPTSNITSVGLTEEENLGDIPAIEIFEQRKDISAELKRKQKRLSEYEGIGGGLNQGTHVFGVDDRKVFKNQTYPWSAVGRVRSSKGVCTGTLVGKRLVVTGSHCIPWTSKGGSEWITFTPAYYRGEEPFGSSGVSNVLVYVKISGAMTNLQSAFDQAVLVLDEPLGEKAGYVGYTTFRKEWLGKPYWYNIGYPIELHQSSVPVISAEGSIDFLDEYSIQSWKSYLLGTFIDMTGGHSGGPVWGFFGEESFPRLVALISSESAQKGKDKDGDNNLSGGPALTHLINHARSVYEENDDDDTDEEN